MNTMKVMKFCQNTAFYLLFGMLFLLPFHAFGSTVLNYGYGLADVFGTASVVSMWKEFVIIILTLLLGLKFFLERKFPKFDILDKLIIAYFLFGILHAILLKIDLSQLVWGARYDYVFLCTFMIVRHFKFDKEQTKKLFKSVIIGGALSLILGYILHYLIKPENLTVLGFRDDWSTWYPGQSLAFCQRMENQELCRMSGTFAGPNQFGAYLAMFIPILYMWRKEVKERIKDTSLRRGIPIALISLAFYALIQTYSRGALIGVFIAIFVLLSYEYNLWKHIKKKHFLFGLIGIVVVSAVLLITIGDTLIRPESTSGHIAAWIMGIQEMFAHPLGQGLGSAGPASYRFANPIIPESWYLQVGIELGFFGLLLFLGILVLTIKKLFQARNTALLASFLGVLAIAFFLHTFEDSAVSITLFSLLGLKPSKVNKI
ncbi:MAG: O-antigen ligase family protein [Candidatus Peregrinibacteria bacterium]|nr:O-antigen ligase family protein [Candidatus Peregrinibacteria bacterium]